METWLSLCTQSKFMRHSHSFTYPINSTLEDVGLFLNMLWAWLWSQSSFTSVENHCIRSDGENQHKTILSEIKKTSINQEYIPLASLSESLIKSVDYISCLWLTVMPEWSKTTLKILLAKNRYITYSKRVVEKLQGMGEDMPAKMIFQI